MRRIEKDTKMFEFNLANHKDRKWLLKMKIVEPNQFWIMVSRMGIKR